VYWYVDYAVTLTFDFLYPQNEAALFMSRFFL